MTTKVQFKTHSPITVGADEFLAGRWYIDKDFFEDDPGMAFMVMDNNTVAYMDGSVGRLAAGDYIPLDVTITLTPID